MNSSVQTHVAEYQRRPQAARDRGVDFLVGWFEQFANSIGLPCACIERRTLQIVARSHDDSMPFSPVELSERASAVQSTEIYSISGELNYFLTPVPHDNNHFIEGFARTSQSSNSSEFTPLHLPDDWNARRFDEWLETVPVCDQQILGRLLHCALRAAEKHRHEVSLQLETQALCQQVDYASQQIGLLHTLNRYLENSPSMEEMAKLCLDELRAVVDCSASVISLQEPEFSACFLADLDIPFDQPGLTRLLKRFEQHDWSKPLVRNGFQDTLFGSLFPGLKNLAITPIENGNRRYGWIASCNLRGARDFGPNESDLLRSIATILATHIRNIQLLNRHDDLQLSFVRSLVSSLDAKDVHTRGHSERVALIARCLGVRLNLPANDLDDLYLASLLHDLGKIGVDDRILSKPSKLTAEEFLQIQQHPMIGYEILRHLKNLTRILPGVRNHHEAYNGTGYPDQLRGDEIPLMARIIAVADSFDAMASDRPYRTGMPIPQLEGIFHRGSGAQWDPQVIDAYFQVNGEVRALFQSYSLAVGNLLDTISLSHSGLNKPRDVS